MYPGQGVPKPGPSECEVAVKLLPMTSRRARCLAQPLPWWRR